MQRWISLLALFNFPSLFSEVVAPEFISLFHQFVKLTVLIFLLHDRSLVIVIFNPQWKCVGLVYTKRNSMHYLQASVFQIQLLKLSTVICMY